MDIKPEEDFERDYFRELFMLENEKYEKAKLERLEYEFDKKRIAVKKVELQELIEC
jgi:hypothetical protein